MRPTLASSLAVLTLLAGASACTQEAAEPAAGPAAPAQAAVLDGVDLTQPLRALGTEPFWSVDIGPDGVRYAGVDRPERTAPNPGPVMTGTVATWTTEAQGEALEITLIATECSDGMSDRTYPLTARVKVGEETLQGCAAATSALMGAGESGPVR
ncbi:MAG: hypothetical protein KF910_05075 [Brevundimonas sp.]|uniref:COG3650 family protein n=1 Tax=Brevundimonas sp. TaxID=1871086 RepID=UPI0025C540B0|nr:hypothetical protein [Brevundimonas sp.]MBX3476955.1 hypothetical protein [Brevundimonas sp.]